MIILSHAQWEKIHERLKNEYPLSVMLIRSKMREVLGFTVREHREWRQLGKERGHGKYFDYICLDFYNDAMETWFQLKYNNIDTLQENQII